MIEEKGVIDKGVIFFAVLALIFSFTARIDIHFTRFFDVVWNFGHILAFYLWTYLGLKYIERLQTLLLWRQLFVVVFVSVVFGFFIEWVQTNVGRSAQVSDVLSDVLGALLALSYHSLKYKSLKRISIISFRLLVLGCILFLHKSLFLIPVNEYYAYKQFPILLDPATPLESTRVRKEERYGLVKAQQGIEAYFDVQFLTTYYSGISVIHFPQDWATYKYLVIELNNPEEAFAITCRIHDQDHEDGNEEYSDRFNQRYNLEPGRNLIQIKLEDVFNAPETRRMNTAEMASIALFTTQLQQTKKMHLFKIKLVN